MLTVVYKGFLWVGFLSVVGLIHGQKQEEFSSCNDLYQMKPVPNLQFGSSPSYF